MLSVNFTDYQQKLARELFKLKAYNPSVFSKRWNEKDASELVNMLRYVNDYKNPDTNPDNLPNYLTRQGAADIRNATEQLFDHDFCESYRMTAVSIMNAIMTL